DTFTIKGVPTGDSPAPALSTTSVPLGPNASQQVPIAWNATGLAPGEYQGYLKVSSTASSNSATIPYWFAVPGSTPAGITVLYQDNFDPARSVSTQAVVFRVVDAAGLPYSGTLRPQV